MRIIAGVDEAGRGPLAGPVYAACVILPKNHNIIGLTDSKKLSAKKRDNLFYLIIENALAYSIKSSSVKEIENLNILQATMLAMQRCVLSLSLKPEKVMVDGNCAPKIPYPVEAIIKGDEIIESISAASILAKVSRDVDMIKLDEIYPEYGFAKHKGYPTKAHIAALHTHGVSAIHRKTFAPVKEIYERS